MVLPLTLVLAVVVVTVVMPVVMVMAIITGFGIIGADGSTRGATQGSADHRTLRSTHMGTDACACTAANGAAENRAVVDGEACNRQQQGHHADEFAHCSFSLIVPGRMACDPFKQYTLKGY